MTERRALIERADTAFVGSLHPARGVDASHRGGAPGFIQVVDATTLRVPDYPGNSMFMTLGNFEVDSRASLAVLDFERGRVVSFSGSARLHFEVERSAAADRRHRPVLGFRGARVGPVRAAVRAALGAARCVTLQSAASTEMRS